LGTLNFARGPPGDSIKLWQSKKNSLRT